MRRIGLALAVALVVAMLAGPASAGGGGCHEPRTDDATTHIDMKGLCFWPTVAYVAPGATVTWLNRDDVLHTVTGAGRRFGDFETFAQTETTSRTFSTPG